MLKTIECRYSCPLVRPHPISLATAYLLLRVRRSRYVSPARRNGIVSTYLFFYTARSYSSITIPGYKGFAISEKAKGRKGNMSKGKNEEKEGGEGLPFYMDGG